MLTHTKFIVDTELFKDACNHLPKGEMKTTINSPTGDFFYDPWEISDEYKGTIWETLYNSLPVSKGEARIIILDPGQCYQQHADIDDRYHLNILSDSCYLINLTQTQMHLLSQDGVWHDMDAGHLHTAANFGRRARIQLVVRKLLKKNRLKDPIAVSIATNLDNKNHARYLFDNTLSPWLNSANKSGIINNFSYSPISVTFNIEKDKLDYFKQILPEEFVLT
jgi:hypothetical protein